MTAIAAWLAERWLVRKAAPLWGWVKAYPWQALCLLLVAYGLWERHRAQGWEDYAHKLESASRAAAAAQITVNHEPARKAAAIAEKSNADAPAYYRTVADAAAIHSVRLRPQASGPINPDLPRADPIEPGVHGPAEPAGLVCRPAVEDSQIVGAAGRAAEMHQEALDLISEGVAVPTQ